jgi:uncharacterized protein (TIGR02246 family)
MTATDPHTADRRAIKTLLEGLAEAWNRHDAVAYAGAFTEDADYVLFDGTHSRGRRAILRLHRYLFETVLRSSRLILEGSPRTRFVGSDVAVAIIDGAIVMPWQRRSKRRKRSIQTYLLVRHKGDWQVAAYSTTRIRPIPESGIGFGMAQLVVRMRTAVAKSFH